MFSLLKLQEDLPKGHYELAVEGYEGQKLLFSNRSTLEIILESVSAMIQTDKAMYKAGQIVKIRSICIYTDLKPYLGKINIIISVSATWQFLSVTPAATNLDVADSDMNVRAHNSIFDLNCVNHRSKDESLPKPSCPPEIQAELKS